MPAEIANRRIRVPRADRSILTIPSLEVAPHFLNANRQLFAEAECSLNGRNLADLRRATRLDALSIACPFTSSLIQKNLEVPTPDSLVVTGHQPELFHVGVWTKNFALDQVARASQSVAINLIIDNDTMNDISIRLPVGTRAHPRIERVPFDAPHPTQPWEEASIRDRDLFRQFGPTVQRQIRSSWDYDPLVGSAWNAAVQHAAVSSRLCDCLTALRANVERAWGLSNLELPMSRMCETPSFLWFAAHLLERLPELHFLYNETVAAYRRSHQLRNRTQPVPDLDRRDDWYEAPFWIWRVGDQERGRLFGRRNGSFHELRDEKQVVARLPVTDGGSLDSAVQVSTLR